MRKPIDWNPYPEHDVPVGRPVLCMDRNEPVPYMALLEQQGPTMTVLGKCGERTDKVAHVSGLVEWADVCPNVFERREWKVR